MRVLEYAEVKEDDEDHVSPLDLLFSAMEREKPDSVAVRQYKVFKLAAGKTAKSILVSTAVRLAPFNLPQIQALTDHDDMDLTRWVRKRLRSMLSFLTTTTPLCARIGHLAMQKNGTAPHDNAGGRLPDRKAKAETGTQHGRKAVSHLKITWCD
mgnify:CR=1 FL=1